MTIEKSDHNRIIAVDVLRGVIMIIMALDHVRDFFHISSLTNDPLDLQTTTIPLFFTRWITHFCAPTFVFLSGVSAYLSGRKMSTGSSGAFLIKRGMWLVVVDLLVMSFALTFNPHYNFIMLTVLWAIGASMILLGLLLKISPRLILPLGLLLFFGHDLFTFLSLPKELQGNGFLQVLFTGRYILPVTTGHTIAFLYAILPWTGVMFLGYSFAPYINNKKVILVTGFSLVFLFLILRWVNIYGDPAPWSRQASDYFTFLSFINTTKYPASLQFLSMTLGPILLFLLIPFQKTAALVRFATVYGRVPFFYFVVHFVLAHVILVVLFYLTGHGYADIVNPNSPFYFRPVGFGFSLAVVYAVWIFVVLALYYPCKWFYQYKLQHSKWWLRYL